MARLPVLIRSAPVSVLALGILLVHVYLLGQGYVAQYSGTDGYSLANGEVVGGDFVAFHQAGRAVRSDPARLYDWEDFARAQQEYFRVHGIRAGVLVFAYPPLVALLFSSLSDLSLLQAYVVWAGLSLALFLACIVALMRAARSTWNAAATACLAALGFYVFSIFTLAAGQTSAVGACVFTAVFLLLDRRREFLAGVILACAYYKPPLFLGLTLVLLFARSWRVVAGFAAGAAIVVGLSVLQVGMPTFLHYLAQASRYRYGQTIAAGASLPIDKGVGVLAAIEGLSVMTGGTAQLALFALTVVGAVALSRYWRAREGLTIGGIALDGTEQRLLLFTLIVSFSLLTSVQMVVYDLSILFPFGAASIYVLVRQRRGGPAMGALLLATVGLYYEFAVRSVAVGPVVIKGTTVLWLAWTGALWVLACRKPSEAVVAASHGTEPAAPERT